MPYLDGMRMICTTGTSRRSEGPSTARTEGVTNTRKERTMEVLTQSIPVLAYPQEDHRTWNRLCVQQIEQARHVGCRGFLEGFPILNLDFTRIPDPNVISARLQKLTNWTLVAAENEFLNANEWFDHLAARRFPVTNYIRQSDEIGFSLYPDLFHEYFGHLSLITQPYVADVSQYFGQLSLKARTDEQRLALARLWWFIFEVGFIREGDDLKVIGGALLSSPDELQHACKPEVPKYPFSIEQVTNTPGKNYTLHEHYFYVESLQHIREILDEYMRQERLDA